MKKFRYLLYKDYLLLKRDLAGLLLMFLMPVVLVILMTLLQESTFRAITDASVPLILINNDKGELGKAIDKELEASGVFKIERQIEGKVPTLQQIEKEIASSRYTLGIFIPENTTENIQKNVARYVLATFSGAVELPAMDSVGFVIYVDPTTKASFYTTIMSTLKEKTQKN